MTTPGAVPVFRDVHHAAGFWLENRAPRGKSLSAPERFDGTRGRSTNPVDTEAALRAIERGLDGLHPSWHGVVLVAAGWRLGVARLRATAPVQAGGPGAPYLVRAGFAHALPMGLTRRTLLARIEDFRRRLAELGVIDRAEVAACDQVEGTVEQEKPLKGWKEIAAHVGCSERLAKEFETTEAMPVYRRGGTVFAFASELNAWIRGGGEAQVELRPNWPEAA